MGRKAKKQREHVRIGVRGRFAIRGEFGIYQLFVARPGESEGRQIGSAIDFDQAKPWLGGKNRPRTIEIHHVSKRPAPRGLEARR